VTEAFPGTTRAARERGLFGPLDQRRWIAVRGPDAASHLHAMLTQALADLPPGGARYAALVDDRSRYLADAWVLRPGEEWVLDAPAAVAGRLAERLAAFAVAAEVELVPLEATHALYHWEGGRASGVARRLGIEAARPTAAGEPAAAAGPAAGSAAFEEARLLWAHRSHFGEPGYTVAAPRALVLRFEMALAIAARAEGLWASTAALAERLRLEAGRVEGGRDVTEADLLAEAGLWAAVSLEKGCFPGQEILQRVARQGRLKRRLAGLRWEGESSYAGAETPLLVDAAGAAAGNLTSWAPVPELGGGVALAWVRSGEPEAETGLRLVAGGVALPCRVVEPPFVATGRGRLAETPRPAPAEVPARGGEGSDGA
jgi:folate-binding protein YgfZ